MPLIAISRAHGLNDFPLHFAFFAALERRGVLDRFDFALDPAKDPAYCAKLIHRFPQLRLTLDVSRPQRLMKAIGERLGRGGRIFAYFDRFDAVCEAPGGRIHPLLSRHNIFQKYPGVRRRAILFHSIEARALENADVRRSVGSCDLVLARTSRSAENAVAAGARGVVATTDIVFSEHPRAPGPEIPGVATALRLPRLGLTEDYMARTWEIVERLERTGRRIDYCPLGGPESGSMELRGYGTSLRPSTGLYGGDEMYSPFVCRRDAIISCRLHTTILALMLGNRKILQFQIESETNKIREIFGEIGLEGLRVRNAADVSWKTVSEFLDSGPVLAEAEVSAALEAAKAKTEVGLDAFEEWLDTLRTTRRRHGGGG